ncbi:NAD(P)/FAD-dependent oxidoreductase [Nesterenkonia sp. CL21]|uniref:FAD-dependent oxidoreductase n=1 Tax=Nesterenkonia sp. CL21 TaxID=3064894 RepID=UPI00287ACCF3|nr:NAD(P)/FAD-dependent oxidoreductase [Nesterenkonia sp. CL21]MDS2172833.1 NAD(P)/FAD-dependent oxidoreductase [Nesterenkonia sp. CL21]
MPEVIVVGAGPVGLLMAGELRRRGIDVELVEQRTEPSPGTRAIGVHPPVLTALEGSGITEGLLKHAVRVDRGEARSRGRLLGTVRFDRLSARFPFVATLPQAATEAVLARSAPTPVRGVRVTGLTPVRNAVRLSTDAGERHAPLVVLAGGARSRNLVHPELQAHTYPDRYLMTDAEVPDDAAPDTAVVHLAETGVLESFPLPGGRRRFVAWDPPEADEDSLTRSARMEQALTDRGRISTDGVIAGEVTSFGVRRLVAPTLRRGRVVVVGDAAHEVSPIGGQGMNLGLLDAVALAPLLAAWLHTGASPEADLRRWELSRIRSARRAALLAGVNLRLGRPAPPARDALRRCGLRAMLSPGARRLFARAYAMGFDAGARAWSQPPGRG